MREPEPAELAAAEAARKDAHPVSRLDLVRTFSFFSYAMCLDRFLVVKLSTGLVVLSEVLGLTLYTQPQITYVLLFSQTIDIVCSF